MAGSFCRYFSASCFVFTVRIKILCGAEKEIVLRDERSDVEEGEK
jgi:hypothetical protein